MTNLHPRENKSSLDKEFFDFVNAGDLTSARLLAWNWQLQFPYSSKEGKKWHDRYESVVEEQIVLGQLDE